MRKSLAAALLSLLAVTGCAAPTAAESAPATVTVTASAEPTADAPNSASAVSASPSANQDKTALYLEGVRMVMPAYGFPEYKLSDTVILKEGHKICEQGDSYKGDPALNKKAGATKALVFEAESKLC